MISKERLEMFSDGVFAIIITIMVLELHPPVGASVEDLRHLWPIFASYILSFIFIGIYWVNHHHLFLPVKSINGNIMWANLLLLFWLSLVPFCTAWLGEHYMAQIPTALYGIVLLGAAKSFSLLSKLLIREHGKNSELATILADSRKGRISVWIYILSLVVSTIYPRVSYFLFFIVAVLWFVPDKRIERVFGK